MKTNWLSIGAIGALVAMAFAFGYIIVQFGRVSGDDTAAQQAQVIESALQRAAVQCYALEGSYPPNEMYLEEHYGISFDHNNYFVHYRYEGSNLVPQIRVFKSLDNGAADPEAN